ncbi:MAG: ATP-binding protein [Bacteriovoracaceae bacterium]|nr:ATP-binding protein [Bacteriovoracaceae bacterium]
MKGNQFTNIGDQLPLWHFEDDTLVFQDGSLGAGFSLQGLDISTTTNEVINGICSSISNLINSLEEGLRIQVFYKVSSDVSKIIHKHKESISQNDSLNFLIEKRLDFFKENEAQGNFYRPEILFFIRSKNFSRKSSGLFARTARFSQMMKEEFNLHFENFQRQVTLVRGHLENMQLDAKKLSHDEWFKELFQYFNLKRSQTIGSPKVTVDVEKLSPSLLKQLILSDLFVHRDYLEIDRKFFKVINMGTLPDKTSAAMAERLTKLPFHYWVSQSIEVGNQKKEVDFLQLKRRMAYSMAAGSKNVSDLESESKLENLEGLLQELIGGNEKVLNMGLCFIIWGDSVQELQTKSDQILRELRSLNNAEGIIESMSNLDNFIKSFPGSCESYTRKKVKTSNASHLFPIFANWSGNSRPVCLFPTRDLTLFGIDPFAPELPNWNGLVVGGSGSGKSFTLSSIMLQFATQAPSPKIVIIDNGRSSENLVKVLGGEFIDVGLNSQICLNPFELPKGEKTPSSIKIKSILAILELIFRDEQMSYLPKRDKSLLEESIMRLYEVCTDTPTLSDLKLMLDRHSDPSMKKYGDILFSWTGNSAFGKILDGKSNITLQKNITAIEIKGLDDFPDLKDVFMLLVTNFVQKEAESDLSTPYVLICDEAHRLFKTPSTRDYILYCYRVFRKYNCSIFCITQNHKDFLSIPEVAEAIFPNTTHVFILRQRKIDWEDFQKTFDFTNSEIESIKSLQIKKREFSEVFYMQDEKRAILKIIPDSFSYWICTSDGNDKAKIEELKMQNPDWPIVQVLKNLSEKIYEA